MDAPTGDGACILICDDSIEEMRVLVSMLRSARYRIVIATNGREACDRASLLKPDLILLDIRMPVMDGLAACRILKAHPETRPIPVIFLTAANELADRLEGLRCGAIDYIVKPANEEEVLLRVAGHIRRDEADAHFDAARFPRETSALVRACIDLLERDLAHTPSAEELCQQLGTSRYKIDNAFKEVFGSSVRGWLRERRMTKACEWLSGTDLPISAIATNLGYNSSGNFTTAFRERFNVVPTTYREETQALKQRASGDGNGAGIWAEA